jgi:hypothetical protein
MLVALTLPRALRLAIDPEFVQQSGPLFGLTGRLEGKRDKSRVIRF